MKGSTIKTATAGDEALAIDTVVLAFAADPMARWVWPESHQYLTAMPPFVRAFGGGAFAHGSALCTEDYSGTALWLPPGVHSDDEVLGKIAEQTVSASLQGELGAVMEQMARHHPQEPHWYLPLIGVDPAHQGKGRGEALMAHAVRVCDRNRKLAYLESTNPRNISLYLRHGFEAIGRIQVGTSPPVVPMVRQPR